MATTTNRPGRPVLTAKEYLARVRDEQLHTYAAVDRKLEAIHAHVQGGRTPALHEVPYGAGPLARIEGANYCISAASVVIADIAGQALAAGVLSKEDHATMRALMDRQRMHAERVATWARDPRYQSETTEAIRDAVSQELAVLLSVESIILPRSGERAVAREASAGR